MVPGESKEKRLAFERLVHPTERLVLLRRRTKGNLACFHSFLQVFEMGFLGEISHFDGK